MNVVILTNISSPNNSEKISSIFSSLGYSSSIISYKEEDESQVILNAFRDTTSKKLLIIKGDSIVHGEYIPTILKEGEDNKIDILFLNKNKDECENQVKITQNLRFSIKPNSIQAVLFNSNAISYILKNYKRGESFTSYLNDIALKARTNKIRTAVTSINVVDFDINLILSVNDFEKLIQCDFPYSKNKLYSTGSKLFIFIIVSVIILIAAIYLLLLSKDIIDLK